MFSPEPRNETPASVSAVENCLPSGLVWEKEDTISFARTFAADCTFKSTVSSERPAFFRSSFTSFTTWAANEVSCTLSSDESGASASGTSAPGLPVPGSSASGSSISGSSTSGSSVSGSSTSGSSVSGSSTSGSSTSGSYVSGTSTSGSSVSGHSVSGSRPGSP